MDSEIKKKIDDIINGQPYFTNMAVYDPLQYQFNYNINAGGPVGSSPNVTINNGGTWTSTNGGTTWTSIPYTFSSTSPSNGNFKVTGDAEIDGDIKMQGRSLKEIFNSF